MIDDNEWSENLEQLSALSNEDIEKLWVKETVRRNAEIDAGTASMRDTEDVFRDLTNRTLENVDALATNKRVTLQQNQTAIIQTKCCTAT